MFIKRLAISAVAAATFSLGGAGAHAAYPDKPVTVIVPQSPGGTNDIVARLISDKLAQKLGQPFVVQNKPGAGGNIGTAQTAREAPDGYTVLFTVSSAQAINPALYKDPGFDPVKDFAPVAAVGTVPNVLIVHPSFPANTLEEFIKVIKANPGKYQYASAGNGTLNHLLGAMLDEKGGLKLQHIPYRGVAPAMTDVLGGQVPMIFASLPSSIGTIKSGKLRALGVSTKDRNPALPDVPAIGEQIPGFAGELWIAMYVPKNTPKDVIDTLYKATQDVLADPDVKKKYAELGVEMLNDNPEQLAKRQQADLELWGNIVKSTGAQLN
ncbi:tripartite tricarboxylate transporter substrate binding protein [Bordetella sp. 15P40C-2]|uniref:Bug family tripartite tricarboxylate transporter substrate binding protein n=1 Tax=Bordetella sp. 15P40C-2 TaxID=2572246 RepID=UPI0013290943|nr:tripartite tricarboxylate transporter substrate binding protein [Bordetella sp. 15P40C-2]MVW70876.1 tripartite tricarboxylate transporter substrate binding protein [Bordetella sp. 15P40C-2]